jgi:hypothetical protein
MDVHIFDGRLLNSKEELLPYLSNIQNKVIVLEKLRNYISHINFDTIINDSHNASNHDLSTNLHAYDLLYLCGLVMENLDDKETFILLLNEQLDDMNTGMCVSGRITRLFQLIIAFKEFL